MNENLFAGKDARLVWASAAYGFRMNGYTYVKEDRDSYYDSYHNETIPASISNRTFAYTALSDPSMLEEADFKLGEEVHQYFKGLTFKAIMGKLNSFEKGVLEFVDIEDWSTNPLGIYQFAQLVSLPMSYYRGVERERQDGVIRDAKKEHVGEIGERMTLDVEVVRTVYSEKWCTFYVTSITADDQIVFFAYRQNLDSGTKIRISGTVKAHRDDGQTQFNRVRTIA
jgi:hypothetical protein